ncbi:hypothetical protein B5X24_HaOG215407 [Helicoverpa armigera]|nr:hypothetical protein B5X24_HaOG215407 [Helicoverpa armigera]
MSTSVDWSGAAPPWVPLCLASPLNLSGMSISTGRASGSLRHASPTTTTTWGPPRWGLPNHLMQECVYNISNKSSSTANWLSDQHKDT